MSNLWYYYLHQDGSLIGKNPEVVEHDDQYFNSPFVKKVWMIDLTKREDAWTLVLEALALGASLDRAKELAEKWKLTYEDSFEMLSRVKPTGEMKEGMKIMIEKIFKVDIDQYWESVLEKQKK